MATSNESSPGADDADLDLDLDDEDEEEDDDAGDEKDSKDKKPKGEKSKETLAEREARLERQLKQTRRKLGKDDGKDSKEDKSSKDEKSDKKGELDYGQKAFLRAEGIKGSAEMDLVMDYVKNTGKSIEDVLESKHFQGDLKDLREEKETDDATPKGSKRGGSSSKDSVDYWLAKGGLPEDNSENRELRTKIVNARSKKASSGSQFATTAVVK